MTEEDRHWLHVRGLLPRRTVRGWLLSLWRSGQARRAEAHARGAVSEFPSGPNSVFAPGSRH